MKNKLKKSNVKPPKTLSAVLISKMISEQFSDKAKKARQTGDFSKVKKLFSGKTGIDVYNENPEAVKKMVRQNLTETGKFNKFLKFYLKEPSKLKPSLYKSILKIQENKKNKYQKGKKSNSVLGKIVKKLKRKLN